MQAQCIMYHVPCIMRILMLRVPSPVFHAPVGFSPVRYIILLTLFLDVMTAILLNRISSSTTAVRPFDAAMCAHVMPSCENKQKTHNFVYLLFLFKQFFLLNNVFLLCFFLSCRGQNYSQTRYSFQSRIHSELQGLWQPTRESPLTGFRISTGVLGGGIM